MEVDDLDRHERRMSFVQMPSVPGAIFLILEMYTPYTGVVALAGAPLHAGRPRASRAAGPKLKIPKRTRVEGHRKAKDPRNTQEGLHRTTDLGKTSRDRLIAKTVTEYGLAK